VIKPGTYMLARDVKNPSPDRRFTRDPRCKPVWLTGTEFLVIERQRVLAEELAADLTEDQRQRVLEASRYTVLQFVGDGYPTVHEIGPGNNQGRFDAIVAALVPVVESTRALFTRLGVSTNNYFARWLVESGRLTPKLFEQLWLEYEGDGDLPGSDPTPRATYTLETVEARW